MRLQTVNQNEIIVKRKKGIGYEPKQLIRIFNAWSDTYKWVSYCYKY